LDEHQFVAPPVLLADEGALLFVDYPYFHMPTLGHAIQYSGH